MFPARQRRKSAANLGVAFVNVPPDETRVQGGGALIDRVVAGSAAQRAGLKPGQIVTQINGMFVANPQSAAHAIREHHAGDTLRLTVVDLSNGITQWSVLVTLSTPPAGAPAPGAADTYGKWDRALKPQPGESGPGPTSGTSHPNTPVAPHHAPPGRVQALGNPTPLRALSAGTCTATAPPNWRVTDINAQNSEFVVTSPDNAMRAAWGIVGINGAQAAGYYGLQYRTPAALTAYLTGVAFGALPHVEPGPPAPYGFHSFKWTTPNRFTGYALFRVFPYPMDQQGYILSYRIGGASSNASGHLVPLAVSVAASIRCTTLLRTPAPNDFHPSRGARCFGAECSEADAASGAFNSILGTGYVHDSAGNNYYVGSENWIENGPDGPGYYKKNGNDVVKLQPGLE